MTQIDFRLFCPISRVANNLRHLLKKSAEEQAPIVITQKGYPTAVVMTVDQYTALTNPTMTIDLVPLESESDPHEGRAS